jgi:hypothetical protein
MYIPKAWADFGNPWTPHDRDLFAVATKVAIGNGKKAFFGWLLGLMVCGQRITPLIFGHSKKKIHGSRRHGK